MPFLGAQGRGLVALSVLVAGLAVASAAHAVTPEDRAAAREHLTQAQDLKKQGQLAQALTHFEESQRLDPKLTTALDLADCAELAGKLVEAQGYWAAARDQAKRDEKPQSRARAEQRLAAVEKRVAHLSLQLAANAPVGTQVLRDDVPLEQASLANAQPLNPGDHLVVVKATGHEDAQYPVKLTEGDNQTLAIAAGPAIAVAAPPPPPPLKVVAPPPPQPQDSSGSGSGQRTIGLIAGGVGVVGIGVGIPLWYVGYRDGNSYGPTADQQLLSGQILVIGGGALLVTGAVLFLTAPSGSATKSAHLPITPTLLVARNATVLGAAGEF
jgi:hypothetical protein